MITFYPHNDGTWGPEFDFSGDITLVAKCTSDNKTFRTRAELRSYICTTQHMPMAVVEFIGSKDPKRGYGFKIVANNRSLGWATDNYC